MRLSNFCLGFLVAGAAALSGQQSPALPADPAYSADLTMIVPGPGTACPAAVLHATQGSSSQVLRALNGPSQPVMLPTLTLTPLNGHVLASATVTARGLKPIPSAMDLIAQKALGNGAKARAEIAKTLTVRLSSSENGSYSAVLQLVGFTTVQSIHLDSVTYSDGSTWIAEAAQACSVTPDPFLLIGD